MIEINKGINYELNYDLTIEELKRIYGVDYNVNPFSVENEFYVSNRNNYEDFVRMFGSHHVATKIEEVNEDTVAFVGDLNIGKESLNSVCNLRYIYGNFNCYLESATNLENLEIVYGATRFFELVKYDGLENLRSAKILTFDKLDADNDLSTLEFVYVLYLSASKEIVLPRNINTLRISCEEIMESFELPQDLMTLKLPYIKCIKNLKIPKKLENLWVPNIDSIKGSTLPEGLKIYVEDIPITLEIKENGYLDEYVTIVSRELSSKEEKTIKL